MSIGKLLSLISLCVIFCLTTLGISVTAAAYVTSVGHVTVSVSFLHVMSGWESFDDLQSEIRLEHLKVLD